MRQSRQLSAAISDRRFRSDVAGKRESKRLKTDRFSEKCFELVSGEEAAVALVAVQYCFVAHVASGVDTNI